MNRLLSWFILRLLIILLLCRRLELWNILKVHIIHWLRRIGHTWWNLWLLSWHWFGSSRFEQSSLFILNLLINLLLLLNHHLLSHHLLLIFFLIIWVLLLSRTLIGLRFCLRCLHISSFTILLLFFFLHLISFISKNTTIIHIFLINIFLWGRVSLSWCFLLGLSLILILINW